MSASPSLAMTGLPLLVLRARRREVAAGYIDFDPAAGAECVVNVAEIDRQRINPLRHQRLGSCGGVSGHRPPPPPPPPQGAAVPDAPHALGHRNRVTAHPPPTQDYPATAD